MEGCCGVEWGFEGFDDGEDVDIFDSKESRLDGMLGYQIASWE